MSNMLVKKILIVATVTTLSLPTFANYATYQPSNRDNSYYNNHGYGETSEANGRYRTKKINSYNRKDGSHVDGYYRSR